MYAIIKVHVIFEARLGFVLGKITKVVVEIRDCRQYIEEGIYEAQVCGDSSMLAQFTMQNVLLNLMEGVNLSETMPILDVSV